MKGRKPKDFNGPALSLPECPKNLNKAAKKEWNRLIGSIASMDERDRQTFANYCMGCARIEKANAMINKQGEVVKSVRGFLMPNPWLTVLNSSTRIVEKAASKLGLTPFARGQIQTTKTIKPNSDWDGLLADGRHTVKIANVD